MSVYSIGVVIHATAYVRAASERDAVRIARRLTNETLELAVGDYGDVAVSNLEFHDPRLPALSLSPAVTIGETEGNADLAG